MGTPTAPGSDVPQLHDAEIERRARQFKASFMSETGVSKPPRKPDGYVTDWLVDRDKLDLIFDENLGFDVTGNRIVGNTVVMPVGGMIIIAYWAIDQPFYSFTVAHELGHWILHRALIEARCEQSLGTTGGRSGLITCYGTVETDGRPRLPPEERQANRFATHLLMPADQVRFGFRRRFREQECGYGALRARTSFETKFPTLRAYSRHLSGRPELGFSPLNEIFGVSVEAMAIRLEELLLVHA
jgi:hypothetical protein